jgi:Fe-S cluster assembly scaffold protein SufB
MVNEGLDEVVERSEYKEKYGFYQDVEYDEFPKGISEDVVRRISKIKNEPDWMLQKRLTALKVFNSKPTPNWGADLSKIKYEDYYYFMTPKAKEESSKWENVPDDIKQTFDKLGVPEAERKFFSGAEAQFDSSVVYSHINEELEKLGIIFTDTDTAVKKYPEIMKKYWGTIIPATDNKFAALNTACWSGGSFIYVPKGVNVPMPLNAYFRINAKNSGQFERTLIIAEEGADVTYLEGCTAPVYASNSLHAAVVELVALEGAHIRYVTIQNWSKNVYNLVTQRAHAAKDARVEWIDANIGCLVKGTKVFTNNDVKNIEEVNVGDKVYSLNQNFEIDSFQVLGKKENPPSDVYRLLTMNHREILATPNHPILVMKKEGKYNRIGWIPLGELKTGDLIAISGNIPDRGKPYQITGFVHNPRVRNRITAPNETTEDLMWLLGAYIGDGCMEKARVSITMPTYDPANPKVKSLIKSIFGLESKQHHITIRIGSEDLVRFIKLLGFSGNAQTKQIPRWVYRLPKQQKLAFIEGYLAADGHIKRGHKNVSITSCNKQLLQQLKDLAISAGLNPGKIAKWTRTEKKPLGKEIREYTHYYFYFADNKFDLPLYFTPLSKVEYIGKQETYDIEVDGTHNFIANGIFVHNSKVNMKYPSIYLQGERARGEVLSIAIAGDGQIQDSGGKIYHLASNTTSKIVSKSISKGSGVTSFRGLMHIAKNAANVKAHVSCDALLLDETAKTNTYPYNQINRSDAIISHEAKVGKISDDDIFYLMSRGIPEDDAIAMIVLGFIDDLTKVLPLEYSLELKRLIKLDTSKGIG